MNTRLFALFLCLCILFSCDIPHKEAQDVVIEKEETTVTFHKTHEPKKEQAPFSDIVQVDNLYFLSGQIGMDPVSYTHLRAHRDQRGSRMPSSA